MISDKVAVPVEWSAFCHFFRKLNSLNLRVFSESSDKLNLGREEENLGSFGLRLNSFRKEKAKLTCSSSNTQISQLILLSELFFSREESIFL